MQIFLSETKISYAKELEGREGWCKIFFLQTKKVPRVDILGWKSGLRKGGKGLVVGNGNFNATA